MSTPKAIARSRRRALGAAPPLPRVEPRIEEWGEIEEEAEDTPVVPEGDAADPDVDQIKRETAQRCVAILLTSVQESREMRTISGLDRANALELAAVEICKTFGVERP